MKTVCPLIGLASCLVLLAGCSSDGVAPANLCEKLLECAPGQTPDRCEESMADAQSTLRPSAWADLSNCLAKTSCADLLIDGSSQCMSEAAQNAPEDAADGLLQTLCSHAARCGQFGGVSEGMCMSMVKGQMQSMFGMIAILADDALDCLAGCIETLDCDQEDFYTPCLLQCDFAISTSDTCENGTALVGWCICDEGYAGDNCTECAEGFRSADDRCLPTCTESACSGYGACSEGGTKIHCSCDSGYEGDDCESCAPGYARKGDECQPLCNEQICSGHGKCDGRSGEAVCSCDYPYSGPTCDSCDAGYDLVDEKCTAPVASIAVGGGHICALLENGDLRCWGTNSSEQLGLGPVYASPIAPADTSPVSLGDKVQAVAPGQSHTVAILHSGKVRAWGSLSGGRLGFGTTAIKRGQHPIDLPPVKVGGQAIGVAAGQSHSCALLDSGEVRCWGNGPLGLGNSNIVGDDEIPTFEAPVALGGKAVQVVVGTKHSCALLESGLVRCWGSNHEGALGLPLPSFELFVGDNERPVDVDPVPLEEFGEPAELAAGNSHSCARFADGSVICWGEGEKGQLGQGNTSDLKSPQGASVIDLGGVAKQIVSGGLHTCALLQTGNVRCWGANGSGQLGYASTEQVGDSETPADAGDVNVGGKVKQLAAYSSTTCALLETGGVRCWGSNPKGAYGYGHEDPIGDNEHPADAGDIPLY